MARDSETVGPGLAELLKSVKTSFWINVIVLTLVLGMMLLIAILNGPTLMTKKILLAVFLLASYIGLLFRAYYGWQDDKKRLMGKNRITGPVSRSNPPHVNPNTAPTSRIDVEEIKRQTDSGKK